MIQFEHVHKTYRRATSEVAAISDLSFSVDDGEFIAVRGPSGCGKSTLLSLAGGLVLPTQGRILIDGQPVSEMTAAQRSSGVANVSGLAAYDYRKRGSGRK